MRLFEGRTANEAWSEAAAAFLVEGQAQEQASRAGSTREILHAAFTIHDPLARWVLARRPAINPAFAIVETIWILAGREDSALPNHWNPKLPKYTGSGERYHGAYGHRLRRRFGFDQLERAYLALKNNPDSRQVVLQIWKPNIDLPDEKGRPAARDVPCNVLSMLKVRDGKLEWTQVMRSNDLFRGVPYNFVQFTVLQEVLAGWLSVEVGSYNHFSDSLHLYEEDFKSLENIDESIDSLPNADSLSLPKKDSDIAFAELERQLDTITNDRLAEGRMRELLDNSLPESFKNLLVIAAADSALRRGWSCLAQEAAANCTNGPLLQAWDRWALRTSAT